MPAGLPAVPELATLLMQNVMQGGGTEQQYSRRN